MITKLLSPLLQSGRAAARFTALLGLTGLAMCGSARATVIANDPFSVEIIGYNTTTPSGNFYAIATNLTPAFGTTQTYTNSAANGQTVTVTSGETKNGNIFTDTITISVPNSFIPAGTLDNNGNVVNALEFSIGNFNIPTGGTANLLDYTTAINLISVTGTLGYTLNGTQGSLGLTNTTTLSNGNKSFSSEEAGQTPNGGPISNYNPSSFTYTITYSAVPEPSTTGAVLLGVGGLIGLTVVRRRRALA